MLLIAVILLAVWPAAAMAVTLEVSPDAPAWARFGADALLYSHIGGGIIGLVTGAVAIASRKGETVHRAAGKLFLVGMFVAYLIGAGVAPFLTEGQRPNFTAGVLALYLLLSGVRAAQQRDLTAGRLEVIGLVVAISIVALGYVFMRMGAASPTGTVDGSPPQAFYLFMIVGGFAVLGDLNLIIRKRLSDYARIARHLWRMCASLFIAAGSLFLGQPQVFPDWFNATPAPFLFAFAPLVALVVWLAVVRFFWPRRS